MPTHMISPLDARIGALRKIQEQIAAIRSELGGLPVAYYPDVAAELRAVADSLSPEEFVPGAAAVFVPRVIPSTKPVAKPRPPSRPPEKGTSIRERMIKFFIDRDNKPATIADISIGLGVGETGVGTILYRRNNVGEFKRAGKAGGTGAAPATLWSLTDAELAKQRAVAPTLPDME